MTFRKIAVTLLFLSALLSAFAQPFTLQDQPFMAQGSSAGSTLLNGLIAAWSFDEQVASGNRTEPINSTVLKDSSGNAAGIRGTMFGAVSIPNGAGRLTNVDNSIFGPGNNFTIAAWCIGQNGANSWVGESTNTIGTGDCYRFRPDGVCTIVDNGATPHTINLTLPTDASYGWNLIVMGCDSVNMFASAGGAAPSTTACTSVRKTGCPFWCNIGNSAIDELYIWNRALTAAEISSLYRSGQGFQYPFTNSPSISTQISSNYLWAVVNAGGAAPAQASLNAITTLVDGFITDATWGRFTNIVTFIPDNLTAATMPIYPFSGYDAVNQVWKSTSLVINSFVGGDLTVNGLTANGGKTLSSVVPGLALPVSSHLSVYTYIATQSGFDAGVQAGAAIIAIAAKHSDGKSYSYNGTTSNEIKPTSSGNGFYMGTRVSTTDHRLFFASSVSPWAQIGATDTLSGGGGPNGAVTIFGVQGDALNSSDTLSGFTAGGGFSTSEGQSVYNRWQTFRNTVGGGFR